MQYVDIDKKKNKFYIDFLFIKIMHVTVTITMIKTADKKHVMCFLSNKRLNIFALSLLTW